MTLLADLLSTVFERRYRRDAPIAAEDGRPLTDLAMALVGSASETSGLALASEILARFGALEDDHKLEFFRFLASSMNIDPEAARTRLDAYERAPSKSSYRAFAEAAEPRRQELIRRLNRVQGATGELVKMRADLLRLGGTEPELAALDLDFRHLFASWFNRGFLVLRPISWESPAHILEKIIAHEAAQLGPAVDGMHRLVGDQLFEQCGGRVPGNAFEIQESDIEPGGQQVAKVIVQQPKVGILASQDISEVRPHIDQKLYTFGQCVELGQKSDPFGLQGAAQLYF